MNWQPIETAPKDGTKILVYTHHGNIELSSWYRIEMEDYVEAEGGLYLKTVKLYYEGWNSNTPTHWQPLPLPPEQQAATEVL